MTAGLEQVLAEGRQLRRGQAPAFLSVVAVHAIAAWVLFSVDAVRTALVEVMPAMVVTLLDSQPEPDTYTPPPPSSMAVQLTPLPDLVPVEVQTEVPLPATEAPRPQTVAVAVVAPSELPEPARVPVSLPRTIPASAVEYVVSPRPVYPLYSRRSGETGVVMLRVLIDEQGRPAQVRIEQSSGYGRLDAAAVAAMRAARFKPYTENGMALAVWAPAPIIFEL